MGYQVDAIVIGAGVIGLAIARALAIKGMETIVLEMAADIGSEISSRNSEVIHAGIYYPPGSLKAELCVRGKAMLYDYLRERSLPHARCGKLIVASHPTEKERLTAIANRAQACGVSDLTIVSVEAMREMEPNVRGELGLLSPSTGIVDSHQLMLSLQGELEAAGGVVAFATPVVGGALATDGKHWLATGGSSPTEIGCRVLVNAAGLYARDVWLRLTGPDDRCKIPAQYYAKGHYYTYSGVAPFNRLVYPLPSDGGLGVHATIDLGGQARFGPDIRWVNQVDYRFDDSQRDEFVRAVRSYYPALDTTRLQPGYTGIRPKVVAQGEADGDFVIATEQQHGLTGFYSLHGIESPGLTASLAIAEKVVAGL